MTTGFKKLRGVPLSYERQGQIYFSCVNYAAMPVYTQIKIDMLCDSAGGQYAAALRELLLSGESAVKIAQKYYISEEQLQRARREFYKSW